MILDYIKVAVRNIIRNKINSLISIGGLVLGITCFLIIFIWVRYQLSFDKYHENSDNIVRVIYKQDYNGQYIHSAVSPSPLGPALKSEYSDVVKFSRYSIFFGEVLLTYKENKFYEGNGAYADPDFLDMFSIEILKGNRTDALDDPYSVILTESLAKKYFNDSDPINKILYLEGFAQLRVTAVIKDIPKNSHLKFDFLVPYTLFTKWGTNIDDWNNWAHQYTYLELGKNTKRDEFEHKIINYVNKYNPTIRGELYLQELTDIHLNTNLNYDNYSDLQEPLLIKLFVAVGLVILIIACLNFINLTTAQYFSRTKEAGIRKILGANRIRLIARYITESLIIAFISIHLSLILIEMLRNKIEVLSEYNLTLIYSDPFTAVIIFILLIVIGVLSGIFPALFLSAQEPNHIFKSKALKHKGVVSVRKVIVIAQFILASCLIIVSIYSNKQISFLNNKELGYNPEGIIAVQLRGNMQEKYNTLKQELLHQNYISYVSYGSSSSTINSSTSDQLEWKGKKEFDSFEVFSSSVDFDYIEMMQIQILEGRSFSGNFTTDSDNAFIINETAAKKMSFENPIGESISFMGRQGQIIGVAKDYHFSSLYNKIEPLIISIRKDWRYFLFIKLENGKYKEALSYIESKWNEYNSEFPFSYTFIADDLNESYIQYLDSVKLILKFTIIAIFIALIGLNALTLYITKARNKEIGIRKVLGATNKSILYLLNWDFIKMIIASYLIAVPLSIFILKQWMCIFAYKQEITFDIFMYSGLSIIFFTIITISAHAIVVARKNPVESLRYE